MKNVYYLFLILLADVIINGILYSTYVLANGVKDIENWSSESQGWYGVFFFIFNIATVFAMIYFVIKNEGDGKSNS